MCARRAATSALAAAAEALRVACCSASDLGCNLNLAFPPPAEGECSFSELLARIDRPGGKDAAKPEFQPR